MTEKGKAHVTIILAILVGVGVLALIIFCRIRGCSGKLGRLTKRVTDNLQRRADGLEQVRRDLDEARQSSHQAGLDSEQAERDLREAGRDSQQAERDNQGASDDLRSARQSNDEGRAALTKAANGLANLIQRLNANGIENS